MPSRNEESDSLQSSPLMVSPGTLLIVDETKLREDKLDEKGIKSFCALKNVLQDQQLPVSFDYYSTKVPIDCSIIVASSVKTITCDMLSLNANFDQSTLESNMKSEVPDDLPESTLELCRKWWALTRLFDVKMSEDVVARAKLDFVRARQTDDALTLTSEDFHRWLTIARLLAASHGDLAIQEDHWVRMRELEIFRVTYLR